MYKCKNERINVEIFVPVDHGHHLRHWAEAVEEGGDHGHDRPVRPPGVVGVTLEDLVDDEVAGEEGGVAVEDVAQQILKDENTALRASKP